MRTESRVRINLPGSEVHGKTGQVRGVDGDRVTVMYDEPHVCFGVTIHEVTLNMADVEPLDELEDRSIITQAIQHFAARSKSALTSQESKDFAWLSIALEEMRDILRLMNKHNFATCAVCGEDAIGPFYCYEHRG